MNKTPEKLAFEIVEPFIDRLQPREIEKLTQGIRDLLISRNKIMAYLEAELRAMSDERVILLENRKRAVLALVEKDQRITELESELRAIAELMEDVIRKPRLPRLPLPPPPDPPLGCSL